MGGSFCNYSLNTTPINRIIYFILGKKFHTQGVTKSGFHLTRANRDQRRIFADIFGGGKDRYTELFFHPDLNLTFSGRIGSLIGKFDINLSRFYWLGYCIGRQKSFETKKSI
jgi:hypothetical protein